MFQFAYYIMGFLMFVQFSTVYVGRVTSNSAGVCCYFEKDLSVKVWNRRTHSLSCLRFTRAYRMKHRNIYTGPEPCRDTYQGSLSLFKLKNSPDTSSRVALSIYTGWLARYEM